MGLSGPPPATSRQAATRHAVYWLPAADSLLWQRGCRWLGRDAERDMPLPPPPDAPSDHAALVAEPARYGLHATLRPPFRLAAGQSETEFGDALAALAAHIAPMAGPVLAVAVLGRFLALRPAEVREGVATGEAGLAETVTRALDGWRAPLDPAEMTRRLQSPLDETGARLLARWGYPYVMARFRFHVTLTGPVAADRQPGLAALLEDWLGPALTRPCPLDELAWCAQPPGEPFRVVARIRLTGGHPAC